MRIIDELIKYAFNISIQEEKNYLTRRQKFKEENHEITKELDVIDSKSSALLTHVSIMLAVLAVLVESYYTKEGSPWLTVLVIGLVLYSISAV